MMISAKQGIEDWWWRRLAAENLDRVNQLLETDAADLTVDQRSILEEAQEFLDTSEDVELTDERVHELHSAMIWMWEIGVGGIHEPDFDFVKRVDAERKTMKSRFAAISARMLTLEPAARVAAKHDLENLIADIDRLSQDVSLAGGKDQ